MIDRETKRLVESMDDEFKYAIKEFDSGSMEFLTHMFVASNLSEIARNRCLLKRGQEGVDCDNFVVGEFEQSIKPLADKIKELMK